MKLKNACYVFFEESNLSYVTSLTAYTSLEGAEEYFLNEFFNRGVFPEEKIIECIGICFIDKNSSKIAFRGKISKENLEMFGLVDYYNKARKNHHHFVSYKN